jgi:putative membrane protein
MRYPVAMKTKPPMESDPRVYFAAERTLLAWIRTGLTIIALGFVVARFGLFLEIIHSAARPGTAPAHSSWLSSALGIALVGLGSLAMLGALRNHLAYIRTLPAHDVPDQPMRWLPVVTGLLIAVAGILLAGYLAFPR